MLVISTVLMVLVALGIFALIIGIRCAQEKVPWPIPLAFLAQLAAIILNILCL